MASQQTREERFSELRKKAYREKIDRLTAVKHVTVSHFREHVKLEDYQAGTGQLFGCDRLMKMETMFGRIQFSYNPHRKKSFLFMNVKTSRYDSAGSSHQKKILESQINNQPMSDMQNKAFTSTKKAGAAVLIEKGDRKPWSEATVRPYYKKANMQALDKTMPFFTIRDEKIRLAKIKRLQKNLEMEVQSNTKEGLHNENTVLRKEQLDYLTESNLLQYIILKKNEERGGFFRKINYAFDMQKNEMFQYYTSRRDEEKETPERESEEPVEDEE